MCISGAACYHETMTDQNHFSGKNQRSREQVHFTSGYQDQPIRFRDRKSADGDAQDQPIRFRDRKSDDGDAGSALSGAQESSGNRRTKCHQSNSSALPGTQESSRQTPGGYGGVRISRTPGREYTDGLSDEAKVQLMRMYEAAPLEASKPETEARDFYLQGREVSALEDHFPLQDRIVMYYPSYQSMTLRQLRVYFTWRTVWRKLESDLEGKIHTGGPIQDRVEELRKEFAEKNGADTFITQNYSARNMTFAYMHAYELINNTDDIAPEEGYLRLAVLYVTFGRYDSWFRAHLRRWMRDFAIYYDLDPGLAFDRRESVFEQQVKVLENFESRIRENRQAEEDSEPVHENCGSADGNSRAADGNSRAADESRGASAALQLTAEEIHDIFVSFSNLSSRDALSSPFYRKYPQDLERAAVHSYAGICRFYLKNHRRMALETAFGGKEDYPYYMFQSAIFYDRIPHDDYEYVAGPGRVYVCRNGRWTCRRYLFAEKKNQFLGEILHETERILRMRLSFGPALKQKISSGALAEVIRQSVDDYLKDKREAARPKVDIHFEGLQEIRRAAAHTRDRLIVDEDAFEDPIAAMHTAAETNPNAAAETDLNAAAGTNPNAATGTNPNAAAETNLNAAEETNLNAAAGTSPNAADEINSAASGGLNPMDPGSSDSGGAAWNPGAGNEETVENEETGENSAGDGHAAGPLSEEQTAFLSLLMNGGDWKAFVRSHTDILSVSLLVDSINEALYDEIGDTVIELDGDTPVLIEDYREDLERILYP